MMQIPTRVEPIAAALLLRLTRAAVALATVAAVTGVVAFSGHMDYRTDNFEGVYHGKEMMDRTAEAGHEAGNGANRAVQGVAPVATVGDLPPQLHGQPAVAVAKNRLTLSGGTPESQAGPCLPSIDRSSIKTMRDEVGVFAKAIHPRLNWKSGFSYSIRGTTPPVRRKTYMVSVGCRGEEFSHEPSAAEVGRFVLANLDLLMLPGYFVGGWVSAKTGKYWIDVSKLVRGRWAAQAVASANRQEAIFDLNNGEEVPTWSAEKVALKAPTLQHARRYSAAKAVQG
jgi:hypothetical protein